MLWATVPEAAVDKYSDAGWAKGKVCAPPESGERLPVDPITESKRVQAPTNCEFGPGIARPLELHPAAHAWR